MKVVFLDIEGVLVNRNSLKVASGMRSRGDAPCVAALNRITSTTGAYIVVSSTWRLSGADRCRKYLTDWGVTALVLGITPDGSQDPNDDTKWLQVERGVEIEDYLRMHPSIDSFVILDDDSDMAHLKDRLVKTEFEIGLTEADADQAIALITEQETPGE
jgi:hypothetical protein